MSSRRSTLRWAMYTGPPGRPTEAIVELKRALELAPNSDEGYRRLGDAYLAGGKTMTLYRLTSRPSTQIPTIR